ncbi:molybdopterin-dependent oxidoreductase [Chloroflexota bacterium]
MTPGERHRVEAKRKRKAKLIVVDPRRTQLASMADLWLAIRPGTDSLLALGMLRVIIEEELYDKEFVDKWCSGFDRLSQRVKEYPLEKVAELTWIPVGKIKAAARMYATTKPAALHHRVAIEHNVNTTRTERGLISLVAITGNIDIEGGNLFQTSIEGYISSVTLVGPSKAFRPSPEVEAKRIGSQEFPLIAGSDAVIPFVPSPIAMETLMSGKPYPIKALYCAGGNPVINLQNSKRVWKALQTFELHVVTDFFMTPSAELADYVLPATTWLEREECCDLSYVGYISARQKAIEPLYECWDDTKILIELVKRIPWANRKIVPWDNVDECNEWMVSGMGITFDDLKKKGCISVPLKYKKYEEKGFDTPSGKVELYPTAFEKHGYDPLPSYREPPEGPVSTPELMKEYPFILISGTRHIAYFHSEGRQIPALRKLAPDPEVEIHPDAAKKANIKNGDWVWLETPKVEGERVRFKTRVTPDIHPKVVSVPHGWWFPEKPAPEHGCFDSNINVVLSADPPREEVCASVPTRGTLCKVYK